MVDQMSKMISASKKRSTQGSVLGRKRISDKDIPGRTSIKCFIITDPCYIMDDKDYDNLGMTTGWEMTLNGATEFTYKANNNQKITIFRIKGTPHGDGESRYHGYEIGVDAGLLCIAYNKAGWEKERAGAHFWTYEEAAKAFPGILRRF
jgi:hypothetical protein